MQTIDELKAALEQAHATNRILHRRVQHAEAAQPAQRSRGRAQLAADCVRLTAREQAMRTALGKIRALAKGWSLQPHPISGMQTQTLRDIAAEAEAALTITPYSVTVGHCEEL